MKGQRGLSDSTLLIGHRYYLHGPILKRNYTEVNNYLFTAYFTYRNTYLMEVTNSAVRITLPIVPPYRTPIYGKSGRLNRGAALEFSNVGGFLRDNDCRYSQA